ncbi:hypothetical protein LENED_010121 [Lentinula edodes]|uniref:Uncharacterized protein n=1 Tax=Lentinula edodes TaxID=5353 RepID=A0A1Q3ELK3_LENED|nr:hypothetical protein LENED_010121 [Lentinula edodes]
MLIVQKKAMWINDPQHCLPIPDECVPFNTLRFHGSIMIINTVRILTIRYSVQWSSRIYSDLPHFWVGSGIGFVTIL